MKEIDASYLGVDSPADAGVSFFRNPEEPDLVWMEIATVPSGKVRLVLGVDDLLKLSVRMHAVARQARGEPAERGKAN